MSFLNFKLGLDIRAFNAGITKARSSFNSWSKDAIKGVGGQIAGAMALENVVRSVGGLYRDAAQIQREAFALGISTDEYQALGKQARLAGVDVQDLVDAMNDLNVRQYDAIDGSKEMQKIFERYGVTFEEGAKSIRQPMDLFREFATGMAKSGLSQGQILRDLDETMSDTGKRLAFGVMQGFFENLDLSGVRYKGEQIGEFASAYRELEQTKADIADYSVYAMKYWSDLIGSGLGSYIGGTETAPQERQAVLMQRKLDERLAEQTKTLKSIDTNTKPLIFR